MNNSYTVSFCIPTYNSGQSLDKCLTSISKQSYPVQEILIVDGYSTDSTIDIAKRHGARLFFTHGSLSEARQVGVSRANSEILALIDDDIVIPDVDWLNDAVKLFDDPNTSTVWPICIAPPNAPLLSRCYSNYSSEILLRRLRKKIGIVGGTNALFRKNLLQSVGGFDRRIDWGEDFYIAKLLRKKAFSLRVFSKPLYHETMFSLSEFTAKQVRGARSFSNMGLGITGLLPKDLLFEQLAVGSQLMLRGIFGKKDTSWSLFPLLTIVRLFTYGITSLSYRAKLGEINFVS